MLSNEREAAINGRVGECAYFSHCEGLLHVRVLGERRCSASRERRRAAGGRDVGGDRGARRRERACRGEDALDGALACVAADRPDTVHRGERVRLAVEALGRDEMEVALRCGEAGEVAEAAADGTLTAAPSRCVRRARATAPSAAHPPAPVRRRPTPRGAAPRRVCKDGLLRAVPDRAPRVPELSRSGGDSPWDSLDCPSTPTDVDHNMMRH